MATKFKEAVQENIEKGLNHPIRHEIGEALTRGGGPNGYLAVSPISIRNCSTITHLTRDAFTQSYLKQLQSNPLRTKMVTSGTLSGLQELLASWIAQDRNKDGHYFTSRVPKMAVYGSLISAPLGHVLISLLQRIFAGQTSLKAKLLQILVSNVVVCLFLLRSLFQPNLL